MNLHSSSQRVKFKNQFLVRGRERVKFIVNFLNEKRVQFYHVFSKEENG